MLTDGGSMDAINTPLALRLIGLAQELEDHGQHRLAAAVAFGLPGAMAHGGESAFDGVGRPQVGPVFGREVVEGEQRFLILAQALAGFGILLFVEFHEVRPGLVGGLARGGQVDVLG